MFPLGKRMAITQRIPECFQLSREENWGFLGKEISGTEHQQRARHRMKQPTVTFKMRKYYTRHLKWWMLCHTRGSVIWIKSRLLFPLSVFFAFSEGNEAPKCMGRKRRREEERTGSLPWSILPLTLSKHSSNPFSEIISISLVNPTKIHLLAGVYCFTVWEYNFSLIPTTKVVQEKMERWNSIWVVMIRWAAPSLGTLHVYGTI